MSKRRLLPLLLTSTITAENVMIMIMRMNFSSLITTVLGWTVVLLLQEIRSTASNVTETGMGEDCEKYCGSACQELQPDEEEYLCFKTQKQCNCGLKWSNWQEERISDDKAQLISADLERNIKEDDRVREVNKRDLVQGRDAFDDHKNEGEALFGLGMGLFIILSILPFIISCIIGLIIYCVMSSRPRTVVPAVGGMAYTNMQPVYATPYYANYTNANYV